MVFMFCYNFNFRISTTNTETSLSSPDSINCTIIKRIITDYTIYDSKSVSVKIKEKLRRLIKKHKDDGILCNAFLDIYAVSKKYKYC